MDLLAGHLNFGISYWVDSTKKTGGLMHHMV
jgi:hypothetical protein